LILLDSQVLVWATSRNPRLGDKAKALLESNDVFVSSISALELTIKQMLGKLDEIDWDWLAEHYGAERMDFVHEDARALLWFPALMRHDPFDRALVAHAASRGVKLLTSDAMLLSLGESWILDCRE
jgi:PIN domain nuclease of toxin-antitoxin system